MEGNLNEEFWDAIDRLVVESEIIIDRPKDTVLPKYPNIVYPDVGRGR